MKYIFNFGVLRYKRMRITVSWTILETKIASEKKKKRERTDIEETIHDSCVEIKSTIG